MNILWMNSKKILFISFECFSEGLWENCWKVSSSFIKNAFSLSIGGCQWKGRFFLRKILFVFVWALDSELNNNRFFNEKFLGRLVKTAHYVSIGDYRGEVSSFFLFFWFVVKMSKKDLDFGKERQGGIICIILSNIYLTFIGKSFWEVSLFFLLSGLWRKNLWLWSSKCRKWCRNCNFFVSSGSFWGWKTTLWENSFQILFLILT